MEGWTVLLALVGLSSCQLHSHLVPPLQDGVINGHGLGQHLHQIHPQQTQAIIGGNLQALPSQRHSVLVQSPNQSLGARSASGQGQGQPLTHQGQNLNPQTTDQDVKNHALFYRSANNGGTNKFHRGLNGEDIPSIFCLSWKRLEYATEAECLNAMNSTDFSIVETAESRKVEIPANKTVEEILQWLQTHYKAVNLRKAREDLARTYLPADLSSTQEPRPFQTQKYTPQPTSPAPGYGNRGTTPRPNVFPSTPGYQVQASQQKIGFQSQGQQTYKNQGTQRGYQQPFQPQSQYGPEKPSKTYIPAQAQPSYQSPTPQSYPSQPQGYQPTQQSYQPNQQGYQTGQGYQPTQQSYQPSTQQSYQPSTPQGYQPSTPGSYQPSQQPTQQGYQPAGPPQQGYQPTGPTNQGYQPSSSQRPAYQPSTTAQPSYSSTAQPSGGPTTQPGYSPSGPTIQTYSPTGPSTTYSPNEQGYPAPSKPPTGLPEGTGYPEPSNTVQPPFFTEDGDNQLTNTYPNTPGSGSPGSSAYPSSPSSGSQGSPGYPSSPGSGSQGSPGYPSSPGSGSQGSPGYPSSPGTGTQAPATSPGAGSGPGSGSASGFRPEDGNSVGQHPPHIHELNVKCSKESMIVDIEFNEPFNGVIYSKGHHNEPECRYVQPNSNTAKFTFTLNLNSCGTQYIENFSSGGPAYLENTLVIQNEPGILEIWDYIRNVKCLWEGSITQSLSTGLSIDGLNQEVVTFSGDTAKAKLELQAGRGPFSYENVNLVRIGDLMTLVISVDGDNGFNIRVGECIATDGQPNSPNRISLTDENGCTIKDKVMGAFQFTKNPSTGASVAYAFFRAFKFPDVMELAIECSVQLCKTECAPCQDPNQQIEPRRRRRDVATERWRRWARNATDEVFEELRLKNKIQVFLPEELPTSEVSFASRDEQICITPYIFYSTTTLLLFLTSVSTLAWMFFWYKAMSHHRKC